MLIWRLLAFDPAKRLTAAEALQHPYFLLDLSSAGEEMGETAVQAASASGAELAELPDAAAGGAHYVEEEAPTFVCPVCGRRFSAHEACHRHVKARDHGSFCAHEHVESDGGAEDHLSCMSAHSLLPVDVDSGYCDLQGRRAVVEDYHSLNEMADGSKYYGVYDGHNGNVAAKFVTMHLAAEIAEAIDGAGGEGGAGAGAGAEGSKEEVKEDVEEMVRGAFARVNDRFLEMNPEDGSGATATVLVKTAGGGKKGGGGQVIVANVGDSRAVLCEGGDVVRQITVDHNPGRPEERARIEAAGGFVEKAGGVARVAGMLAVSRSFGDRALRGAGVVAEPHVEIWEVGDEEDGGMKGWGAERYVILATDGLWDVVQNEEAAGMAGHVLDLGGDMQEAAEFLTREAYVRGSKDNIGVAVVRV
jgi:serine/threonine protein phosphatase PrpC